MIAAVFIEFLRQLNLGGIRYLVAGGVAVNIHGVERLTGDIDLILETSRANLERFWDLLSEIGFQCRVPIVREQFADSKAW